MVTSTCQCRVSTQVIFLKLPQRDKRADSGQKQHSAGIFWISQAGRRRSDSESSVQVQVSGLPGAEAGASAAVGACHGHGSSARYNIIVSCKWHSGRLNSAVWGAFQAKWPGSGSKSLNISERARWIFKMSLTTGQSKS